MVPDVINAKLAGTGITDIATGQGFVGNEKTLPADSHVEAGVGKLKVTLVELLTHTQHLYAASDLGGVLPKGDIRTDRRIRYVQFLNPVVATLAMLLLVTLRSTVAACNPLPVLH